MLTDFQGVRERGGRNLRPLASLQSLEVEVLRTMSEDVITSDSEPIERLHRSVRHYGRLSELRAGQEHLRKELCVAWTAWADILSQDEAAPGWPEDLEDTARNMGFLESPSKHFAEDLARLGTSPSRLLPSDPNAQVQLAAHREVTDYAGLFQRSGLFLYGSLADGGSLQEPAEVRLAGEIHIRGGRLGTFDPIDAAFGDWTIQELDRDVPAGPAKVYLATMSEDPAAVLYLFGSKRIVGWVPARVNADQNPMFVPPMLPMSAVRFGVAVGEIDLLRSDAAAATMNELRDGLQRAPRAKWSVVGHVVGFRGDGPVSSDWGLDEDGNVAAYAIDFARLRLHSGGKRISSMPGLQLTCPSLVERLRIKRKDRSASELRADACRIAAGIIFDVEESQTDQLASGLMGVPGYFALADEYWTSVRYRNRR